MARGSRRGRGGTNRAQRAARPQGRRGQRGRDDRLPTAQAGAADAPVGAALSGNVQQPLRRGGPGSAGGPRGGVTGGAVQRRDRRARAAAAMHDFHYVRGDLRWIAITTVASVGLVLALWAAI